MSEKPILFSAPMVNAILDGRKTQTRRVVKNVFKSFVPAEGVEVDCINDFDGLPSRLDFACDNWELCPHGQRGDRLWVKETFKYRYGGITPTGRKYINIAYNADGSGQDFSGGHLPVDKKVMEFKDVWTPSLFMPRWASRITLEITAVRVERVQEISETDVMAEGIRAFVFDVPPDPPGQTITQFGTIGFFPKTEETAIKAYWRLWDSIQLSRSEPKGEFSWKANPWVWVIEFRRA